MVSRVKKKFLFCSIHGIALFRCKRKCWKGVPGGYYALKYEEKCFKCISEDRHKITEIKEEKKKHFKI